MDSKNSKESKKDKESKKLLTTGGAARLIGISPQTLINYVKNGEIDCIYLPSHHRRFDLVEVERFCKKYNIKIDFD